MKLTEQDYKELTKDISDALYLAFDYGVKFCQHIKNLRDHTTFVEMKETEEARCRMFDRICRKLSATVYREEPNPYKSEEVLA